MKFKRYMFAIACISTTMVSAQNNVSDSVKTNPVSLKEVVVSVNKTDEPLNSVAQSVQVYNANAIASSHAQTTPDLLSKNGLQVQMSQLGGGSPTLRGFEANRILLVIDGVRMNNLIYRAGHLQDLVKTDVNSLDRIEVLYGPASTVYGSDALGGAIVLYTKKPMLAGTDEKSNFKVNILSRYGSASNEFTNHFDLNYGTKKFASLTSFTYSDFGDLMGGKNQNPFYDGAYGERLYYVERFNGKDSLVKNSDRYLQVGSAYSQYDIMEKLLFQQNDHLSHSLNIQYSNSSDVPRYDRLTDPGGAGLKSAEWYYGPQTRMLAAYDMNFKNENAKFQQVHIGLNYQAIDESRHNRNFGSDFKNNRIEKVGVLGANIDFLRKLKAHSIRFGADMQMNSLESTANRENIVSGATEKLDTRFPDGDNTMSNFAAYISHTWKINQQVVLTDGLRVGYSSLHSTLVDTATLFHLPYTDIKQNTPVYSGSIGIVHSPSDDVKLSFMISTGFRVPNMDDVTKIFGSSPGMVIVPNVDLKPEKSINYEIGITKVYNNRTRWETNLFYTTLIDVAVVDSFQFNGKDSIMYDGTMSRVYANQNKSEAYIYGFSSNLISQLDENFSFKLGLNYTYGRVKTDTMDYPLDHIPPFMARTALSFVNKKFSSEIFVNFNAAKMLKNYYLNGEDNEQYATPMGMPAWFTLNFRASYKVQKHITLQAGIDNVFDTQCRVFASGINAPGRNIFAALRANF